MQEWYAGCIQELLGRMVVADECVVEDLKAGKKQVTVVLGYKVQHLGPKHNTNKIKPRSLFLQELV